MLSLNQVLVYTDLSEASAEALRVAHTLAQDAHASLVVIRVVAEPLLSDWTSEMGASDLPAIQDAMNAEVRDWLGNVLGDVAQPAVELEIETGDPAVELVRVARSRRPDLVVMGGGTATEGAAGDFAREVLGGVACSVMVVRCATS